ncbi:hypothetical protein [Nocardia sp. XZ_19_385]|uniref:hypothetical protein n=1 Tax=Nocardia sp. XZ_19_385 TaxID=2769488 RepID=UPI00188EB78C|nr:hypothetical protein [Nocardia sp. XZ_19_385]
MDTRFRLACVAVLVSATMGGAALAASTSAAAPADADALLTCKETGTVTWAEPGLADQPATVEWTAEIDFSECTGAATPTPVKLSAKGTENAGCEGEVTEHKGTGTITWSDGSTSEFRQGETDQSKDEGSGPGIFPIYIVSGTFADHFAEDNNTVKFADDTCPGENKADLAGTFTLR